MLGQGGLSADLIKYYMGHSKDMGDMSQRYNKIEEIGNDIGDIPILAENGQKVLDILDGHFNDAYTRHILENERQVLHLEQREVEITNARKQKMKYWTWVVAGYENFVDYDEK
jgi:hypothetical protein